MVADAASVLPPVGDVFASLSHFKIAVHAAALELGIDLCILHGNSEKALLHCRLFTGSTLVKLGEGTRCEFSIAADRFELDSDEVRVISRNLEHSCDATLRAKRREIAAEYTREKLKALQAEAGAIAPVPTIEDNHTSESRPSPGESTENEDDDDLSHQPSSSSQSAQKKRPFPPAKELKASAKKLLEPDFYADNSRSRDKRQPAPTPVRPNKRLKPSNEPTPPPPTAAFLPLPILTTPVAPLAPLDLSAFLHALFSLNSPSDDLNFLALVLNSHGIESVSDLALYLQLEVSSLGALVEEVQVRSGSEAAQGLAQLARELKSGTG
ncbi:hypothetical protein Rhopal_001290-T1 [Rhodotorula paludigena]|uniref:Uncharacterized protein n=1 Tax=Rhodotorula paludigena TaxID=86838 RepID=A0AAV5G770_9BASI|nr:hypothetical protein Rhopal_001290-T1 [Rhodotorula paludigena]